MMHSPSPLNVSRASIEGCARDAAKALGLRPGDELVPLVARIGGTVRYKDFVSADDTTALVCRPDGFEIFVPDHTAVRADTFDIAQNLGFWLMHYTMLRTRHGRSATMSVGRYASPRHAGETESDLRRVHAEGLWFAHGFLMPEESFRDAWHRSGGSVLEIADRFRITGRHAALRAQGLGLAA